MSLDPVRRIISGKKARYTNDEHNLDLDLVQLTDRVTLMGYPAVGTASLYRNKSPGGSFGLYRSQVLKYISLLPAPPLIVNLCPRYENSYPADALVPPADRVVRFPFPDHYPPPLSLLPVAVETIDTWMKKNPQGTLMIHCKAGKGRSGTMALSYLLTLPGLPSAPSLPTSSSDSCSNEPIDPSPRPATTTTHQTHQEKLAALIDFHTSRRMAPGTTSRGVSIASQRRWLGYWARILDREDPRPRVVEEKSLRTIRLDWIGIRGKGPKGLWGKLGGERMAVQVFHYRPSISSSLRKREVGLDADRSADEISSPFDDEKWDDEEEDMLQRVGTFSEAPDVEAPSSLEEGEDLTETPNAITPATTAPSSPHPDSPPSPSSPSSNPEEDSPIRTLLPSSIYLPPPTSPSLDVAPRSKEVSKSSTALEEGMILDADEGIQFKLLLGKSGRKHGDYLPAMAALGIIWFIPSFEADAAGQSRSHVFKVEKGSIDFLKPQSGIQGVEIGFTFV
ncbi:BZ3500_MvSof-1268-A1-R1_Chr4-2g07129 [Microbotryum saponariae]|uniref:phosphatidylinositol-3,4,5-trisphosphate 3-phosphatase n=1 Tax=Microbotryum saponariae TaxID=289078 RepID=A0A2X0LI89_9BASI|nr:BZ3500_MvSof-1268-A1-R1_Chr4-2g07129 [Microbotryum saponariae]SDA06794.1 BZ3501_MvSof-1269-A2-R1_Chr4-2g06840 [Microbotryum saponariae]